MVQKIYYMSFSYRYLPSPLSVCFVAKQTHKRSLVKINGLYVSLKSNWLYFPSLQVPVVQRVGGMPQFVMRSAWQTSNTNIRVSLSFPTHVLVNSLSTMDIMSLDTVTFIQWNFPDLWITLVGLYSRSQNCTTCNQKINEEIMLFHDVCFKDTTWTKHMHFAQMQWRINWTFIFWVQNRHVNLRPPSLKTKKTFNL